MSRHREGDTCWYLPDGRITNGHDVWEADGVTPVSGRWVRADGGWIWHDDPINGTSDDEASDDEASDDEAVR